MAYSPSPHTAIAGKSTQFSRLSGSPPVRLPLSKRDKKRLNMADKLTEISNNFAANRDAIYRQQLQAYQADINFIQAANPYDNKPLDDPADDPLEEAVGSAGASTQGSLRQFQQVLSNGGGRIEPTFKTGKYASKYVQEINNAMEQRDVDLTTLAYQHNFRINQIQKEHEYQVAVAHQEHQLQLETLRQRLIFNVNRKKADLQREKERLDIADTSALLHHPSQFTINNTASPGGPQSNRKTRHTRHRLEMEDLDPTGGNNKRKRKALNDAENGSPTPAGRDVEPTFKEANAKLEAHQYTAPLYSIERLFTEKDFNNHLQQACYDVIDNLKRRKLNADSSTNPGPFMPTTADVSDLEDEVEPNFGADGAVDDVLLTAPEMGRTVTNTSYHATRSTRVLNINNGLAAGESLGELAGRHAGATLIGTYQKDKKKEDDYNRAPALTDVEAEADLAWMKTLMAEEDEGKTVNTKLLDDLLEEREDHVGTGRTESSPQAGSAVEVKEA
ncbi:hypothetical protein N7G274_005038 [Stereocaulon virgatum]|uniref:Uncharacterized protein n=1 Tax=Stereocaulon virgatum TaxID=373712 RepID=A0ABR4ACW6_9LECA